jgi:hypothetical protein
MIEDHHAVKKMERRKNTFAAFSLAGGILILFNILLIAMNGGPLVLSSSSNSIDGLLPNSAPMWFRIAFGIRDYTSSTALVIGAILATVIVYFALSLYLNPRNAGPLSFLIMLLSAVALLYGGGFIIGSILAFTGAALMYEAPRKFSQTLMGKMLSSMTARSQVFQHFTQDSSVKDATMVILFANLLSGIGNGIFTFNVTRIIGAANAIIPFEVLFTGRVSLDQSIAQTPIILMGIGVFKWALLSLILFFVGANLFGQKASLASVAACTGFAYAPIALQLFTPFVFTSSPYLTQWAVGVYLLTNLWMMLILIAGMKQIMNVSLMKSAATVASCGALYTLINYLIFAQVSIPYVMKFQIQPPEAMLLLTSLMIAAPLLFMGKKSS